MAFPVVDGLRGVSIGTKNNGYRKKCDKHSTHFTTCQCIALPIVKVAPHIEAINLALAHPHLQQH
jgi:hypothetical protein